MPTIQQFKQQEDKKRQAYQHFINKGYSPEASAGIVGNLVYESGLDTYIEGDKGYKGGSSFGIAQFRGDRLKRLKERYGDNWTDLNNQLDFVDWELNNTHKKAGNLLKQTEDVHSAGQIFSDYYEIPAKKYNQNKDRANKVEQVYQTLVVTPQNTTSQPTQEVVVNQEYITPTKSTTAVTNLPLATNNVNFTAEINKLEQQAKERELSFLKEYQSTLTTPEEEMVQEEMLVKAPKTSLTDIFNQVSQFVDSPITAQQGGRITVSDKNDPRYKAYRDSLDLYNSYLKVTKALNSNPDYEIENHSKRAKENIEGDGLGITINSNRANAQLKDFETLSPKYKKDLGGGKYEALDLQDAMVNNKLPRQLYNRKIKPSGIVEYQNKKSYNPLNKPDYIDINGSATVTSFLTGKDLRSVFNYSNVKPRQEVSVRMPETVNNTAVYPPITPQVRDDQSISKLSPEGIQQRDFEITSTTPILRNQARIPKSYNIEYSAQRMNEGRGYYDNNNLENVNLETALRAQAQAERAKQYWQQKYGTSLNPNALERLDILKDEAVITPNYQEGGAIKDNIPNLNPKIVSTPSERQFLIDYIMSPAYKENLIKSGYKDVDGEIEKRLKNVEQINEVTQFGKPGLVRQLYNTAMGVPYSTNGSAYDEKTHTLISDPITDKEQTIYATPSEIKAHELTHSEISLRGADKNNSNPFFTSSRLNEYDEKQLFKRQKKSNSDEPLTGEGFHNMQPAENKADLNALKYLLQKEGIYNPGKEKLKKEHLNKLKKSFVKDRLLENYKEDDLIWLMNNIAMNDPENSITTVAQQGGQSKLSENEMAFLREIPISSKGMYEYPNQQVVVPTTGEITMKNIPYKIKGESLETGETKIMYPGMEYFFPNTQNVIETPFKK